MDLTATFSLSPNPTRSELIRRACLIALASVLYLALVIALFAATGHLIYGAANWLLRLHLRLPIIWLSTTTPSFVLMAAASKAASARRRRPTPAIPPRRTYPLGLL